ncbi:MAG: phage major capsid protein [Chloroflexota bacterium]
MDTTIKAMGEDRVGGYLVVFGGPHQKDLQDEYFTPETDLGLDFFDKRPALYHHGQDPQVKGAIMGVIDLLRRDEIGIWCEAQLDKRSRYVDAIKRLVAKGALSWSSGSLPNLVQKAADGRIMRWVIVEGSLTPTPAEPRQTGIKKLSDAAAVATSYKAMGLSTAPLGLFVLEHDLNDQTVKEGEALEPMNKATKTLPAPQESRIDVLRATKFSALSAADMSFLAEILGNSHQGWTPGETFWRELADKTFKAVDRGVLPPDALRGLGESGIKSANDINTVGTSGDGGAWAPDMWRAELWLRTRQDNTVAPLFQMIEMPSNPYELPYESTDPTVYFVAETNDSTTLNPSSSPIPVTKIGAAKQTMTAKKLALRVTWSSELNEDALIPVVENYRRQSIRAMQNAIDNLLVNGDTVNSNANVNTDQSPTAGTKFLAFDGLRKYALVTNTAQKKDGAGAPTLPLLRATRYLLGGAYATQPRNCAWLVDDMTYAALLGLPEFLTMDKAGPAATNITGQVGVIEGVPVFASAELGLSLAASGKISTATPANNTKGQAIIVFRPNWLVGYRRQVTANVEFLPWSDVYSLVVSARVCLISQDTTSAAEVYDLTV